MIRSVYTSGAILAVVALCTPKASADIISFSLTAADAALQSFPGPYGTVQVNLTDSTHATITFTAATDMLFGGSSAVDVNVHATSWTIGNITASGPFNSPTLSNGGSGNVDGFQNFNQTLNAFDGFTNALQTASFLVTDTGGTWANAAAVLIPNNGMNEAAAHVFVCGNGNGGIGPCNANDPSIGGGFAAGSNARVPEPTSILLLGTVLFGAGKLLKRRVV